MRSRMQGCLFMRVLSGVGLLLLASPTAFAAGGGPPGVPDPCTLVTAAELQAIVGTLKGVPKAGDAASGDISCEYATASGPRWISVRLHDGDLAAWKRRNGGAHPVALPDLGKDAFANADAEGSADVYAMKGKLILRVTMPKGPQAVEMDKAIAKKALARLP
ncbi:MAG: hypothetical protein ABI330_14185 [Caldimonas sp.]